MGVNLLFLVPVDNFLIILPHLNKSDEESIIYLVTSFKQLLRERRTWYKTIGKIYCPILNEDVIFNSKGFYHLRYDSAKRERKIKEVVLRRIGTGNITFLSVWKKQDKQKNHS